MWVIRAISLALRIATGDTQAGSLLIGPRTTYTIQHVQPHLILAAPPMHVDWITPAMSNTPEVLNISAVPHGFYSQYSTSVVNSTQSAHQTTNSYGWSVKVSATAGYKFATGAFGSVSVVAGASAGHMVNEFEKHQWGSTSSVAFDASTTTGFGDQVWYDDLNQTFFVYPVIGQTACPATSPGCAQPEPVDMIFTGVSSYVEASTNGANLEWYQPIHEPGNIFSYPWNINLLQNEDLTLDGTGNTTLDFLTSMNPTVFFTDSSNFTSYAKWSNQSNNSVTSGSDTTNSWGTSSSITKTPPKIGGGTIASLNFAYNGSKAFSTAQTTTTTVGESTGFGITRPGTFQNPDEYQYAIAPFIIGDNATPGTLDSGAQLGVAVTTNGILRTDFTADPELPGSGAWWQGLAYETPDVALYHPARWEINRSGTAIPPPANCIGITATSPTSDCATFTPFPQPTQSDSGIWVNGEALWMKGLLITGADADGSLNGEGPQLEEVTAGDPVLIQARIYNDSLVDIPANDAIKVQFYAEPWDPSTQQATGSAQLVDTQTLSSLPGFETSGEASTTPNWTLVGTTKLNTAQYSGQYLLLWVLVYIENDNNNPPTLVPEIQDHGLTQLPPSGGFTSISDALSVLEPHSNNLGFYKQAFFVVSKLEGATLPPSQARLTLSNVAVSSNKITFGQTAQISGTLSSKDATNGIAMAYYDGNPAKGGTLFDVDDVTHLNAGGSFLVETVYHPTTCGEHTLYLEPLEVPLSSSNTGQVKIHVFKAPGQSEKDCQDD